MTKIYIAGPVSSLSPEVAAKRFEAFEQKLDNKDNLICNPVSVIKHLNEERVREGLPELNDTDTRDELLRNCLILLLTCDELHLMPDWQSSKGATIEREVAQLAKIKIVYH